MRRFTFCAGHRLVGHEGKCRNLHGHNYTLEVYLTGQEQDEIGRILDFKQRLFHPNFWFAAGRDVAVMPDGRLMNTFTKSVPAFIHYNGDSKHTWKDRLAPAALSAALRRAYEQRTGDTRLERLDAFLREKVRFLGPTFEQDRSVTFDQICSKGAV